MAIVLLHGLARDRRIMQPLESFLSEQTSEPIYNFSYPSRQGDFPNLVARIKSKILEQCDQSQPMHFIGHSMGGILIRLLLQQWRPAQLGKVIQVGSPNQGTEVVDFLNKTGLFKYIYGVAASRLGKDEHSIIHELLPVDYDLGIIAADQVALKDYIFDRFVFNCDNDGLVAVESTRSSYMKDYKLIHATHVSVISDPLTLQHIWHFIQNGSFIAS